jgi:coproporphyrinogen III oxidase-like Fe-S oxidoreductase
MNDEVLTWAGRPYNFLSLTDFLRGLRELKQENNVFNFDFIAFGSFQNKKDGTHELWRPYQREFFDTFVRSKFADSFSIYMLERHGGTPRDLAKTPLPDDENILEEFSLLKDILLKNDYKRYEVSNFCRSGFASIHNMVYWNMENYLGL